jgi:nucleotide-binding universal stress UspA family protein
MIKLLVAIDDSSSAMKAVDYVAQQLASCGAQIGIVHVLPNLPAIFWDEGHILSEEEKRDRQKVVDKWLDAQKAKMEPILKKSVETLAAKGVPADWVQTRFVSDSTDIADSILETARDGGYQTIVVGRREQPSKHILGSVSGKIINQGSGMTVIVVE